MGAANSKDTEMILEKIDASDHVVDIVNFYIVNANTSADILMRIFDKIVDNKDNYKLLISCMRRYPSTIIHAIKHESFNENKEHWGGYYNTNTRNDDLTFADQLRKCNITESEIDNTMLLMSCNNKFNPQAIIDGNDSESQLRMMNTVYNKYLQELKDHHGDNQFVADISTAYNAISAIITTMETLITNETINGLSALVHEICKDEYKTCYMAGNIYTGLQHLFPRLLAKIIEIDVDGIYSDVIIDALRDVSIKYDGVEINYIAIKLISFNDVYYKKWHNA